MGSPRKIKPKFRGPAHPWNRARLEEEKIIKRVYGLKNKKEIWKVVSELRRLSGQTKKLIRERGKNNQQAILEEKQLLDSLFKYNLITQEATLENVLSLDIKALLERRLQTMVFKKGLALTLCQARQLIVHGHILVNNKKITIPAYLVMRDEEFSIIFNHKSSFADESHPERAKKEIVKQKALKAEEKENIEETAVEITEEELEKIEELVGKVEA